MAATLFQKDNFYITFLNLQSKSMVWCWLDHGAHRIADEKRVLDAIAIEDGGDLFFEVREEVACSMTDRVVQKWGEQSNFHLFFEVRD